MLKQSKMSANEIRAKIQEQCGETHASEYGEDPCNLFILPEAAEELKSIVYYGKRRAVNCYEQQFQGMGYFFYDSDIINVVVNHFLYIYPAKRTEISSAIVVGDENISMYDCLERERDIYEKLAAKFNVQDDGSLLDPFISQGKMQAVVFGHTHPNLGCFFSTVDLANTGASAEFPSCSLVVDPIQEDMKAIVGVDNISAKVTVYEYVNSCELQTDLNIMEETNIYNLGGNMDIQKLKDELKSELKTEIIQELQPEIKNMKFAQENMLRKISKKFKRYKI